MKKIPVIAACWWVPGVLMAQSDSVLKKVQQKEVAEDKGKELLYKTNKMSTRTWSDYRMVEALRVKWPDVILLQQQLENHSMVTKELKGAAAAVEAASRAVVAMPASTPWFVRPDVVIDPDHEGPGSDVVVPAGGTEGKPGLQARPVIKRRVRLKGPSDYDSRMELRQLDPLIPWQRNILHNARSVGMVIRRENLHAVADSLFELTTTLTLGKRYSLCPGEAFADQPVAGEGTAFLISGTECITAAHVFNAPPERYALVFGFELVNATGAFVPLFHQKDIYYFTGITGGNTALDVVKVRLDRVADRPVVQLNRRELSTGTEVYMLGHPSGLPMKAAINAGVKKSDDRNFFFTTLDAFAGNSGSPVFDFATHEVIGILVSGTVDYKWNGSCNVAGVCQVPYCDGEKAVKVSALTGIIK